MPRLAKQFEMKFRTHGGKRRGAGRKRKGPRSTVPHRARPRFKPNHPLHVTLRVVGDAPNLRSPRAFTIVLESFRAAAERFGCRIVHFSVQSNHIHLILEAPAWNALSNAIRGLSIRLAHKINAAFTRIGKLIEDRYHLHVLNTPVEVKRALLYVLQNWLHHNAGTRGRLDPCSSAAAFEGWREKLRPPADPPPIVPAKLWLLTTGWWKHHGKLSIHEAPA